MPVLTVSHHAFVHTGCTPLGIPSLLSLCVQQYVPGPKLGIALLAVIVGAFVGAGVIMLLNKWVLKVQQLEQRLWSWLVQQAKKACTQLVGTKVAQVLIAAWQASVAAFRKVLRVGSSGTRADARVHPQPDAAEDESSVAHEQQD